MADLIHPSRLVQAAAVSDAEYTKKFVPSINNTPDLPVINWDAIGQSAPGLLDTPADLPTADVVVITWAAAEWAALHHVFCASASAMPYGERNKASWSGWQKYSDGVPVGLDYWGYFRLV